VECSAMMNNLLELYGGACDMFVRPQRVTYSIDMLGPSQFRLGKEVFVREDLQLENARGFKLECSHFYNKKFVTTNLGDLSQLSTKQLKVICNDHSIDIRGCVEKTDVINLIRSKLGPDKQSAVDCAPCIVYLHGNCGCRVDSLDALELCLLYGFSLFSVDLSGSGLSEGEYISLGHYEQEDVRCILEYLKESSLVSSIVLWGRSMGAATSLLYSSQNPGDISAIILDSPFSDLYTLSGEVAQQMKLGIPQWIISSGFSLVMQMIRRSVRQRANFDLYAVAPIEHVQDCNIPGIFIHGESDDFVSPKHSLSLYEKYGDNRKEILLVKGDHNSPRPVEAYNYISLFIHRYVLTEKLREHHPEPLRVFGCSSTTKDLDCFYCKQLKGVDHSSQWPYNVVFGVGKDSIKLLTPFTEVSSQNITGVSYGDEILTMLGDYSFL